MSVCMQIKEIVKLLANYPAVCVFMTVHVCACMQISTIANYPNACVCVYMQIKEIVKIAPRRRQTLLFSATMTEQVQQLITMSLKQPVRLAADAAGRAPEELRQEIVRLKVCACPSRFQSLAACKTCSVLLCLLLFGTTGGRV